ncbi:OprO/OprP family phosphate-selective porin [Salinisphaera sp.]|uniref:OprO/OprP family phosphate-selective porin n=1 Tax=Salinisphaera sp. TaxID=1914330 RepID=UPI002D77EDA7|nr:porin [Salinisphaera sp.]HET7314406.1 porin [Salinisphaera sp.]
MTAVVAAAAVHVPAAMAQAAPSNAELANLVRRQAAQIKRLSARIDQLEQHNKTRNQAAASGMSSNTADGGAPRRTRPSVASGPASAKAAYASGGGQNNAKLEQRVSQLEKDHVKVDWSDGAPEFASPDGDYTFGIGGRIQYDFSSTFGSRYDGKVDYADANSRNITGSEFRRLRLDAHGRLAGWVLYKLEVDFADNSVGLRDAYLAASKNFELGKGVVYLGSKFADRGLDARTSSKWTWFTERNTVANGIQPDSGSYLTGITGEFYGDDNWHASLGINKGSNTGDNTDSNNFTVLSRAHWNPIAKDDVILHVGANGFYENFEGDNTTDYRPNVTIGGHYNDNLRIRSAAIDPSTSTAYGLELAGLAGPFAAGAEWGHRTLFGRGAGDNLSYEAYSAQLGYALTGEQFGYSTKQGVWTRPKIAHPVTEGGIGDWELVARYEAIDFENSRVFQGGTGHGTSVGLNWYLNKFTRVLLDYTHWRTHNRHAPYALADDGNSINARAQVVF